VKPRDVVQAAALLAARHAFEELPEGLVAWSDEPQVQAEGDFPQVSMTTLSLVPEGPMCLRRRENDDGTLQQRMLQTYIWTLQFLVEGWKLDSCAGNNPVLFVNKMRAGWYLQAVTAALLDPGSRESQRTPVKMVDQVGQILAVRQAVRGKTLPVYTYEIEFRYVEHDEDPTPVGVIESVTLSGTFDGHAVTITTEG